MTKQYRSDPRGRKFLSAAAFFLTLVILAALNILRGYVKEKFPQYIPDTSIIPERLVTAVMIALAAVYVVFIVILLPMWYKTIRYTVKDGEIIARSGLFSRTYRIMKLSAVQHASKLSLPLSDITCFNFISLNAMGGSMIMMFLSEKDCIQIMAMFDRPATAAKKQHVPERNKYSLSKAEERAGADYVYTDNSSLLSSDEISDVFDNYSGFTQLSFGETPSGKSSSVQLSFSDLDRRNGGEGTK